MPIELGYDTIAILDMAENTSNIIETVKSSRGEMRFDVIASVVPEYYTAERMYPPTRNLTSASHTISGTSYGYGLYETNQSTKYNDSFAGFSAFQESQPTGYHGAGGQYNTAGTYLGTNYLVSGYNGDWITIKMPQKINLTKYAFTWRDASYAGRVPKKYKIYGSNDGSNWDVLVHKGDSDATPVYTNSKFEESVTTSNFYNHFAVVVNKLIGSYNTDTLNLNEWYIYGKELELLVEPQPIPGTTEYKTLTFTAKPDLVYDFTPYNDLASWEAYATSIGATTILSNYNYGGVFQSGGAGSITLTMPSDYDNVSVVFGNSYTGDNVILYIDNVEKSRCTAGQTKTYTQTYTPGQVLKIEENINTVIDEDLIITFSKSQTPYTLTFDNPTECDILIVGGGGGGGAGSGYGGGGGGGAGGLIYKTQETLSGKYKILVGKGGLGMTYSYSTMENYNNGSDSGIYDSSGNILYLTKGGGAGGARQTNGASGGSGGGGGGGVSSTPGSGGLSINSVPYTDSIGNSGGGGNSYAKGGGGGGAGGIGETATGTDTSAGNGYNEGVAGDGGLPYIVNITGENKAYAGGGGGGSWQVEPGEGGSVVIDGQIVKVGGDGGLTTPPGNGISHTGSGGGGAKHNAGGGIVQNGGNGGSGIVIIRYKQEYIQPPFDAQWTYSATDTSVHHYGNVGIGTLASDTTKLTIRGDTNITGNYYKNNIILCDNPWYEKDNKDIYTTSNNVGIGVLDPLYKLHVMGTVYANNGGFSGNGSTSWSTPSDRRIKENVVEASNEVCFENVKNINLYKFNYAAKYSKTTKRTQFGFVAQEVQKYYPKAVQEKEIQVKDNLTINNLLTVDVTQLNYTLYGAIKHYVNEIDKIKSQLGIVDVVEEEPVTEDAEEPVTEDAEEPVTNIDIV